MSLISVVFLMILPEILALLFLIWYLRITLILKGREAKVQVTPIMVIGMRIRGVNPDLVILNAIKLLQAGLDFQLKRREDLIHTLEAHCLAGGNVKRVTAALLEARNRGEELSLKRACAIDLELAGREKS